MIQAHLAHHLETGMDLNLMGKYPVIMLAALRQYRLGKAAVSAVVAYVLVLQTLLTVFAGSTAVAAHLWGGDPVICSEHGGPSGPQEPSRPGHHECCILHCAGLDRIIEPSPVNSTRPRAIVAAVTGMHADTFVPPAKYGFRPLGARAPPLLI